MSKGDRSFYLIAFLLLSTVFGLYFYNNRGAYFRHTYFFKAVDAGSLVEGKPVNLNGVQIGEVVRAFSLDQNFILLQTEIDNRVKIPRSVQPLVQSVGMVGKRILEIQVVKEGPSGYYSPGDTIYSNYHPGPVHLVVFAQQFKGAMIDFVESTQKGFDGTLLHPDVQKNFLALSANLLNTANHFSRIIGKTGANLEQALVQVQSDLAEIKEKLNGFQTQSGPIESDIQQLKTKFASFDTKLNSLLSQIEQLRLNYQKKPNSLHKVLNDPEWLAEFDRTLVHLNGVLDTLNAGNIRLNVDIF